MSEYQSCTWVSCHNCASFSPNPLEPKKLAGKCNNPLGRDKRLKAGIHHEAPFMPYAKRYCDVKRVQA